MIFCHVRYAEFLQDLGSLISIDDAESMGLFLNVERGGQDGRFAYVWQDDIMQVIVFFYIFTVVTISNCNECYKIVWKY